MMNKEILVFEKLHQTDFTQVEKIFDVLPTLPPYLNHKSATLSAKKADQKFKNLLPIFLLVPLAACGGGATLTNEYSGEYSATELQSLIDAMVDDFSEVTLKDNWSEIDAIAEIPSGVLVKVDVDNSVVIDTSKDVSDFTFFVVDGGTLTFGDIGDSDNVNVDLDGSSSFALVATDLEKVASITGEGRIYVTTDFNPAGEDSNNNPFEVNISLTGDTAELEFDLPEDDNDTLYLTGSIDLGGSGTLIVDSGTVDITAGSITGVGKIVVNSGLTLSVDQLLQLTPEEIKLEIETSGSGRLNVEIESAEDANALQGALTKLNFVDEVPSVTVSVSVEAKANDELSTEIDAALDTAANAISNAANTTIGPTIVKTSGDIIRLSPELKLDDNGQEVQLQIDGAESSGGVTLHVYFPTTVSETDLLQSVFSVFINGEEHEISGSIRQSDIDDGYIEIDVFLAEGESSITVKLTSDTDTFSSNAVKYVFDKTPPAVDITSDKATLRSDETSEVTLAFQEKIFDLTVDDFEVEHGEILNLTRGPDGKTWTLTFKPEDDFNGTAKLTLLENTIYDIAGNTNSESDISFSLENVNDLPTGQVVITGSAVEDATLEVDTSDLYDKDGLPDPTDFEYKWLADGVEISSATTSTLTLSQEEVGKAISVEVSYTDVLETYEGVTSSETAVVENVNDAPTGDVTITGTAREDETLEVVSTLADEDGLGTLSYQWLANGSEISGATSSTFTLSQEEVGKTISVEVSYTDGQGTAESVTSESTSVVENVNDEPTGAVTITGTAREDETLEVVSTLADEDGLGTLSYKWLADGSEISGATSSTLTLSQEEVGKAISVEVSYIDGQGTAESVASASTSAVENVNDAPTGVVSISGTASQENMLTAVVSSVSDEDGLGAFSFQWQRDGTDIANATASTYTLGEEDVGALITVEVTYIDGEGATETIASNPTAPVTNVNDDPTGEVVIRGEAEEGRILLLDTSQIADSDGLGTFNYIWKADNEVIADASGTRITLGQEQVGKLISVDVSYTDGGGTLETISASMDSPVVNVNDATTGAVTITGTAREDDTLEVVSTLADEDGLGTLSYQWLADGSEISSATSSTLTLNQDQVGKFISVEVSYTDGQGTAESVTSAPTSAVENVNDAPTGVVSITGTAREDETLEVLLALADEDGLGSFAYKWLADGNEISGATGSTLTLSQDQVGKVISVVVSYTDGQGTSESVMSGFTPAVENVNDAPTGDVSITGILMENETITAISTLGDEDGLGTLSYQWLADGSNIFGATSSTLTLSQDEVGKAISVEVGYTDGQGTAESVTSVESGLIQDFNDPPVLSLPNSPYFMPNGQDVILLDGVSLSRTGSYTQNTPFRVSDADGDDVVVELTLLDAPDIVGLPADIGLYLDEIGGYSPNDDATTRFLEFGGSGGSDVHEFHLDFKLENFSQIYDILEFSGSVSYDFQIQVSDYVNVFDTYDFSIVFEKPWPFSTDENVCNINMEQYATFVEFKGGASVIDPSDAGTIPVGMERFVSDPVERDGLISSPVSLEFQYVSTIANFATAVGSKTAMGFTLYDFDSDIINSGNFAGSSTSYTAATGTALVSSDGNMHNGTADGDLVIDDLMSIHLFNTGDEVSVDDPGIATHSGNNADRGYNLTAGGDQYLEVLPGEDTSGGVMICFDENVTPVYGFGFDLMGREETKRDVSLDIHLSDGTIYRELTDTNALNTGGEQYYSYLLDPQDGVSIDAIVLYEPYNGEDAFDRDIFSLDDLALVMSDKVAEYTSAEFFETVVGIEEPIRFEVLESNGNVKTIGLFLEPGGDPTGGGLQSFEFDLNWDETVVSLELPLTEFGTNLSGLSGAYSDGDGSVNVQGFATNVFDEIIGFSDFEMPFVEFEVTHIDTSESILLGLTGTRLDGEEVLHSYDAI